MNERRENNRTSINHPVIYMISDTGGQVDGQGVGVALDVSDDGMMFESENPIEATTLFIRASCDDTAPLKIEAALVYSMPHKDGKYRSGIRFVGRQAEIEYFVNNLRKTSA